MLTAEAMVEAVSSAGTPHDVREWYDPDSIVFQGIDDGPYGRALVDADYDDAIDLMKAAGINAR